MSKHSSHNGSNKVVIISSTTTRLSKIQSRLDSWLDLKQTILGNTVLVIGDQETETKFVYTTELMNSYFGLGGKGYSSHKLCPQFLIGTPGCKGAGLDCMSVNLVCRIGLPTSLIHFIQGMGCCRRGSNQSDDNTFSIVVHLNNYVYLIERLYVIDEQTSSSTLTNQSINSCMSINDERKYFINNLNKMCRMMFCNYGCWHACFEFISANPFIPINTQPTIPPCLTSCPFCNKSCLNYIKPVNKKRLSVHLFSSLNSGYHNFSNPLDRTQHN